MEPGNWKDEVRVAGIDEQATKEIDVAEKVTMMPLIAVPMSPSTASCPTSRMQAPAKLLPSSPASLPTLRTRAAATVLSLSAASSVFKSS